ncbi:response regulator transcription factor [Rhodoferax sp.]|uniref:response regulator transcription factor n=1 Tax=Rhodoferax sp. TaxID=50421 RepID=UPI00374D0FFE
MSKLMSPTQVRPISFRTAWCWPHSKSRSCTDILQAIHRAKAGRCFVDADVCRDIGAHAHDSEFSAREMQVLRLLAHGLANKQIAKRLSLTEGTVKNYLTKLLVKLGASDRTHAVVIGLQRGVIELR